MSLAKEITDALCKLSAHHPSYFRKELARLISYIPPQDLVLYWDECKGSVLTHDRDERRFIREREVEKKQTSATTLEQERVQALGDKLGWGYDIPNRCSRTPLLNECIVTLFSDGHACKRQEPEGLHLILTKGTTLCYKLYTKEISYRDSSEAEMLDCATPHTYFCIDASGVKRDYKFVYSLKHCPELYEVLQKKMSGK